MNFKVKEICYCALMVCLLALLSQIKIDLPGYVPITLQTLAVYLLSLVLTPQEAFFTCFVYLLMGAIGLPVFAGFHGGIASLVGYTGGYLFAFPIMAMLISYLSRKYSSYIACFIGSLVCYIIGTAWFMLLTKMALGPSLMMCVIPFIPGDFVKILISVMIYNKIKDRISLTSAF
ncbi:MULTISPECIES: biotin transporter BioY [Coprobacillaceae]|uniref:biotin transporter BioY n=1 Tax=Coprobacillaceae TaxID=2810280 RepID=UPI000E4E3B74|nr:MULTISPECIES: biotin transporter BioY [Coprobacillaceae]RHM60729.1 biotin transporter BioY [Coprobacillus sp. AF33-1AC]RHS93712.1 biotin transporter BioY [Erysipelatoclostridium sp. AM42-17]